MHLLVNNTLKFELSQSDLFKTISLRIYEISNSIPFEENDEQNLFVA